MDYQGQNVNPNLTPDMGQNVAAPNNLETPDLPHDIQGMGAIGSSAANAEIEQMMSGETVGQDRNREDGTIDLLSEMPPLLPDEKSAVTNDGIGKALKDAGVASEAQGMANVEVKSGDTLNPKIVEDVKNATKKIEDDLSGFYDEISEKNNLVVRGFRGYGIGEK